MKYWKGLPGTPKEGQCGTMDDLGTVPDSDEITKQEYELWAASTYTPDTTSDFVALYAAATTSDEKLAVIAQKLALV